MEMLNNNSYLLNNKGKCGVIIAHLIDPLSKLVHIIRHPTDTNAIGIYYNVGWDSGNSSTLILFNDYDNNIVSWTKLGFSLDQLLISPYVDKIKCYPLSFISKEDEDRFIAIIIQAIQQNRQTPKSSVYRQLLLGSNSGIITGYNVVNRIILDFMNIYDSENYSNKLVDCPLFKEEIDLTVTDEPDDILYHNLDNDLANLLAAFAELYTTDSVFRNNITSIDKREELEALKQLETQLLTLIISGFENGIINTGNLNDKIRELNEYRDDNTFLPLCINPQENVQVIKDDIPCTLSTKITTNNINAVNELGTYLQHIVDGYNSHDNVVIELDKIVDMYNNVIMGSNVPAITPMYNNGSISGVITNTNTPAEISINHTDKFMITNYGFNLQRLSNDQLISILTYIDSLHDRNRYNNLLNEVTRELGYRRNNRR